MSVPAGTVVAGYTVERVLGVGGMGTVYLARHPVLPRSDALKVLSEELSADAEFEARFLREADIAATLDHPNIVRVYTRGETEQGQLWIAMQFIDGTDAGAVSKRGPMPAQRAGHIVSQVARALDYAHARGVLHRDLKPANFLLSGEVGPRERVLLADFGIARALSEATRLTATGTLVSTVAYTAPEMLEGRNADHRADVYSLGCALYRMLTNRTPFGGDGSVSAVLVAHLTEPPPRATATVPNLPPAIDDVIAKAMAKDPNARYQSAREFAAAAAAALGYADTGRSSTQPGVVPWDNPGTQPWQRVEPVSPPAPLPATGPTAPARDAASPPPGWPGAGPSAEHHPTGPTQPRASTPVAARRQRGRRRWAYVGAAVVVIAASVGAYLYTRSPSLPPYSPQTFADAYGTTTIDHRPNAVAALSLADADVVLSLGVQPVAIANGVNNPPSWLTAMINGHPAVVAHGDLAAVKAAHPDVIIDTAANQKTYSGLAALGPTVARPNPKGSPWNTRAQIDWIGRILGLSDAATKLNDRTAARQADIKQRISGFDGKQIKVVNVTDSGLTVDLSASPAATFLTGLGFTYDADLVSKTPDALEQPITGGSLYKTDDDDVTIVVRVDKKAANGGFDGLPDELLTELTQLIVIDNPDTISALVSGGPAATNYLDDHLVSVLKDKVQ